jgi:predicted HAD superfamily Cof-like phosphohydrolase
MKRDANQFVSLVTQLHARVGYCAPTRPSLGSASRRQLWLRLLMEEVKEFEHAINDANLVLIADAIGDCLYVLVGAALAFGIPIEEVFSEIHSSNMTKEIIDSGQVIEGGEIKLKKGRTYRAPAIAQILRRANKV